ncbi:hypothetical protein [Nocardia thraciensis]
MSSPVPDTATDPAPLPPVTLIEAALAYMLAAHRCTEGTVIYSFGTGDDGTLGIKMCPIDKMPPTATDLHPFVRATKALRATAPIPLWGFGMAYDGHAELTDAEGSDGKRLFIDIDKCNPWPESKPMCGTMLFDFSGDRRDLFRIQRQAPQAVHIPGTDNPMPPPGALRHLWVAALALDPANVTRYATPSPSVTADSGDDSGRADSRRYSDSQPTAEGSQT